MTTRRSTLRLNLVLWLGTAAIPWLGCASEAPREQAIQAALNPTGAHFGELATLTVDGATTSRVESAALTTARYVTVFKRGTSTTGGLDVVLSRLNGDTTLETLHELQAGHSVRDALGVARVDDQHFVVAARASNGALLIASFVVNDDDEIEEIDSLTRPAVTDGDIVSLNASPGALGFEGPAGATSEGHVLIVARGAGGNLGLYECSVDAAGTLRLNSTANAGAISFVKVASVPGSQPAAAWHSRSGDTTESSAAACSNGADDDGDGYADCDDWDCCGNGACDGAGSCVQGTIVTATPNNASSTKLISWKVSAQGRITRARDALTGPGDSVDLTAQSYRRIATVRASNNAPVVTTWNVDASGAFSEHASSTIPVTASAVHVVNGGGARLFVQTSDALGNGYLSTLHAIDGLLEIDRLFLPGHDWDKPGALLSLSSDRALVTFPDHSDTVATTAYRDFSHPLARGSFVPGTPNTATPANVTTTPFVLLGPDHRRSAQPDASIAVGGNFVVVCGDGNSYIYDKAGNNLTGGSNTLSHATLFDSLVSPVVRNAAGVDVDNEQSINRHLPYQYVCDGADNSGACVHAFYDTDCTFDETRQRFVITSAVRYNKSDKLQRHLAIAISKDSDPRHGFNTYMTTDNKYDDNPAMAANGGVLIATWQSSQTGRFDSYGGETLAPSVLTFDISDLSASTPEIRTGKISPWQTGGQRGIATVNSRGRYPFGAVSRTVSGGGVQLFLFGLSGVGSRPVVTDDSNFVPGGRGQSNSWLQIDTIERPAQGLPRAVGKFYVADDYKDQAGANRVHVSGADIAASLPVGGTSPPVALSLTPLPTVGEAARCGGDFGCYLPSVAAVIPDGASKPDIYEVYFRYGFRYEDCSDSTCPSGVCLNGICQDLVARPAIYYTKFDDALNVVKAGVLVEGTRNLIGKFTKTISNSAAIGDPDNDSIWAIHAVPDGTSGWTYVVGQIR